MKVDFQDREQSEKLFKKAYRDPENFGDKKPCRRLTDSWWFDLDGHRHIVKPGFWWDGASIPELLWPIIGNPWDEEIYPGALAHDSLYGSHLYSRKFCDEVLYEICLANGMGRAKAWSVYTGVRAGGWKAYNAKTVKSIAGVRKHISVDGLPLFTGVTGVLDHVS